MLIALGIFIICAILVLTGVMFLSELALYNSLTITKTGTDFFKALTYLGSAWTICGLTLLLIILPWTRKKYGYPALVVIGLSCGLNELIKVIAARPRPEILQLISVKGYSFPSGHSQTCAAFFAIIFIAVLANVKNKAFKISVCILCCVIPLIVGFSRIYLGVHYLGDVICGLALGSFIAVSVSLFWDFLEIDLKQNKLRRFLF